MSACHFFAPSVLLSRELYGLKEEFELRDFKDQLWRQTSSIGAQGYGATTGRLQSAITVAAEVASASASATSVPLKQAHEDPEMQSSAYSGAGPQASVSRAKDGLSVAASSVTFPRDLSRDLAAVRALQEQDRLLTQTYNYSRFG